MRIIEDSRRMTFLFLFWFPSNYRKVETEKSVMGLLFKVLNDHCMGLGMSMIH